jgi:tetratricopeptide (TPR) repeat protein
VKSRKKSRLRKALSNPRIDDLSDSQGDEAEDEAIKLLEDAYESRMDFSFKERAGEVRIKQLKRKLREARKALEADSGDAQAKAEAEKLSAQLQKAELEHYCLCVENYPTDLRAKYEYGIRLAREKKYDDAIPLFQDAQRDPRHKIAAMNRTGLCFFMKGWFADAVDIFQRAIDSYEIKDDDVAKELRYNLARSYQENGNAEKAMELYRKIAQLDFAYKDVRQQIDKLRGKKTDSTS